MLHCAIPELIGLQSAVHITLDDDYTLWRKPPQVAFLKLRTLRKRRRKWHRKHCVADAAIAGVGFFDLWGLESEFEGSAVAVAAVFDEGGVRHVCSRINAATGTCAHSGRVAIAVGIVDRNSNRTTAHVVSTTPGG